MFGIDDAVAAVSSLADTVVKRIWPDATEIEKAKLEKITQELQGEFKLLIGQLDINRVEAASKSLFVSGWRPAVGWVCGLALAYAAICDPIMRFVAQVGFGYTGVFPDIDTDITLQVLLGMLGLAGMRSFEKKNNIARDK